MTDSDRIAELRAWFNAAITLADELYDAQQLRTTDQVTFKSAARGGLELLAEVKRLREAQRWIPVEERLPSEGERVLALRCAKTYHLTCWQHGHWCRRAGVVDKITHWMPLPAAPEEGR